MRYDFFSNEFTFNGFTNEFVSKCVLNIKNKINSMIIEENLRWTIFNNIENFHISDELKRIN